MDETNETETAAAVEAERARCIRHAAIILEMAEDSPVFSEGVAEGMGAAALTLIFQIASGSRDVLEMTEEDLQTAHTLAAQALGRDS